MGEWSPIAGNMYNTNVECSSVSCLTLKQSAYDFISYKGHTKNDLKIAILPLKTKLNAFFHS